MVGIGDKANKSTVGTFADDIGEGVDFGLDLDDVEDLDEDLLYEEEEEEEESIPEEQLREITDTVIGETIISARNLIVREVIKRLRSGEEPQEESSSSKKGAPGRPMKEPPKVQVPKKRKKVKAKLS